MAYDETLADEVRARLGALPFEGRQMFGGVAFMVGGNLAVGVYGGGLLVRVGKEAHDEAEARPGARMFDMSSRPMKGWIVVDPGGFAAEADFDAWVKQGVAYVESLPPK